MKQKLRPTSQTESQNVRTAETQYHHALTCRFSIITPTDKQTHTTAAASDGTEETATSSQNRLQHYRCRRSFFLRISCNKQATSCIQHRKTTKKLQKQSPERQSHKSKKKDAHTGALNILTITIIVIIIIKTSFVRRTVININVR